MKIRAILLTLPLILLGADEEIERFENIEVEESPYIQRQDFLVDAPMQKQITAKEALEIPGSNGDPLKALKTFAGVTSSDNDNAEMIIHGSKPRETRFEINHLPLGYVFHLGGLHSVINPNTTKQIDAYLGAFDVSYYGMGAVIDITPQYPTGSNSGRVHIGLYDSDAAFDMKITDNISIFMSARRSYFDLFADKIMSALNEEGTLTFTLFPQFWDANLIINANYGNHQISLESIATQDALKLNNSEVSQKDPVTTGKIEQEMGYITTGLRWMYYGDSFTTNTLLYQLSVDATTELFDNDYYIKEKDYETGLHTSTVFNGESHITTLGLHYFNTASDVDAKISRPPSSDTYDYVMTAENIITMDKIFTANVYTLYGQDIWSIWDVLKLRYGLRYSYVSFQNFSNILDPRGALIWEISDDTSLSFAIGKYSQLPQTTTVIESFGNPDIDDFENSIHYALNFKTAFADKSELVIEPYYKSFDTLVIEDSTNLYEAVGKGDAYGVDVTYTKKIGDFKMVGAYTYVQAHRQLNTSDSIYYNFYGEIPHTLGLSTSYTFGESGWSASALAKYSNGKLYTPVTGYTSTTVNGVTYNQATYGTPWSERLPSTYDLDIKITYTKKHTNNHEEEFSLEVLNLTTLFKQNVAGIKYSDTYAVEGYYYQMGLLPAFHYTYRF